MNYKHPSEISAIQGLELRVKAIVEGFLSGLHRSPFHGFSVEFSEYRNYNIGDPIRYIDWKVYGKTDKLMIKKYEAETNLNANIIYDISASMNYGTGKVSKLDYSKNLASAIIYILSRQNDAVALYTFNDSVQMSIPAKSGQYHMNRILQLINKLKGDSKTSIRELIENLKRKITKKGLLIFFSDLLDFDEDLLQEFVILKKMGHDIVIFHILDPLESTLDFEGKTRFVDAETKESIELYPDMVKDDYQNLVKKHFKLLKDTFYKHQIEYFSTLTSDYYEEHLLNFLNVRQKKY